MYLSDPKQILLLSYLDLLSKQKSLVFILACFMKEVLRH